MGGLEHSTVMNRNSIFVILVFLLSGSTADKGYYWHVTDFHYDQTYNKSGRSCNAEVPNPGPFGDYWCDSPWRLVEDSVNAMANIKADVDFVLWTGDTVAHIKDAYLTLEENLETLKNTTLLLNQAFGSWVGFFPTLGNHDFYPSDQADVVQDAMYNGTSDIWRQWIDSDDQLHRFMTGGFYHKLISPNSTVRILALNTNLYYTSNHITKNMSDPAGQFAWMKDVLEQARMKGETVIVTAHVPPGVKTPDPVTWFYKDHQETFVNILTNFSDVIVVSAYGHDHSDGFKIIEDPKDASKAIPQFVAPSVTPWRFKIPQKTGLPHNPGVRLVEYDRDTGLHLNYVQYFINLTDTNKNGNSSWEPLYNFSESYGVNDMSVESIRDIFDRMEEGGGKELAQKYCDYAVVSKFTQYCPDKYRYEIICGGYIVNRTQVDKCVAKLLAGNADIVRASFVFCSLMCMLNFILTSLFY